MGYLMTNSRQDFFAVASLLQKSLRRGDMVLAAKAANDLFPKYANYIWKRLLTVSAEDCGDMVTGEVVALFDAWWHINDGVPGKNKGRVFIAKAIILLSKAVHDRTADELNILVSDRLPQAEFEAAVREVEPLIDDSVVGEKMILPEWVWDVHTKRGKAMGKTKQQFLREESQALVNPASSFDNLSEMIESETYVAPVGRLF